MVVAERLGVALLEDACLGPLDEAMVAGAAAAELGIPLAASPKPIDDAGEDSSVVPSTWSTTRTSPPRRYPLSHEFPEIVRYVSEVRLHPTVAISAGSPPQIFHES